jgi:hypothetical protein
MRPGCFKAISSVIACFNKLRSLAALLILPGPKDLPQRSLKGVAQTLSMLYRRLLICRATARSQLRLFAAPFASGRSADCNSAMPQIKICATVYSTNRVWRRRISLTDASKSVSANCS